MYNHNVSRSHFRIGAFSLVLAVCAHSAKAEMTQYEFSGEIDFVFDAGSVLPTDITPASQVVGTFAFDDAVADSDPSSSLGRYHLGQTGFIQFVIDNLYVFRQDFLPGETANSVQILDGATLSTTNDSFLIRDYSSPPTASLSHSNLYSSRMDVALSDTLNSDAFSSDVLEGLVLNFTDFNSATFRLFGNTTGTVIDEFNLRGTITSLQRTNVVPEPSTFMTGAVGLLCLAAFQFRSSRR